jgi:23S rRNA pseudouridine1911/1915/1917 synthase
MSDDVDVEVGPSLAGVRVDRALSLLTERSRRETGALVAAGMVRIDGVVVARASRTLVRGERLAVHVPPDAAGLGPDPAIILDVVLDDPAFAVVNKPAGLVVHPGAGAPQPTLVAGALARFPEIAHLLATGVGDPERPGIVHRLDKGTSGLLVLAKTPAAFASLSAQMAAHTAVREYIALVEGHVRESRGVVDAPLGRSARDATLVAIRLDGRPARTRYEVRARRDDPRPTTLLSLHLDTGRTHQIRVHLASIEHPVVNDTRYSHRRDPRLAAGRLFLHAATLSFAHPTTGDPVTASAPLPADLVALMGEAPAPR